MLTVTASLNVVAFAIATEVASTVSTVVPAGDTVSCVAVTITCVVLPAFSTISPAAPAPPPPAPLPRVRAPPEFPSPSPAPDVTTTAPPAPDDPATPVRVLTSDSVLTVTASLNVVALPTVTACLVTVTTSVSSGFSTISMPSITAPALPVKLATPSVASMMPVPAPTAKFVDVRIEVWRFESIEIPSVSVYMLIAVLFRDSEPSRFRITPALASMSRPVSSHVSISARGQHSIVVSGTLPIASWQTEGSVSSPSSKHMYSSRPPTPR